MKYTLRPYQQEAVDAALADLNKWRPALIVAPTGCGKSLIIAWLLEKLEWHTIVFQPSKEILEQNYEKFVSFYGDSDVWIYSASMGTKEIAKVTFATIGSVKNKMEDFKHFDNVIIDECIPYRTKIVTSAWPISIWSLLEMKRLGRSLPLVKNIFCLSRQIYTVSTHIFIGYIFIRLVFKFVIQCF